MSQLTEMAGKVVAACCVLGTMPRASHTGCHVTEEHRGNGIITIYEWGSQSQTGLKSAGQVLKAQLGQSTFGT